MDMRVFYAAAMIALLALAGPAYAQHAPKPPGDTPKTPQDLANDKAADKAYKKSLGNIPDQPPADPWGGARSLEAPKPVARAVAAKPHVKTGVTAN
jgi:hypothetical protein